MSHPSSYDVIIIGAGAAGLMAAIQAGKRDKRVLLIEHTDKIGEKIRISGGGRCNFTNLGASSANYISQNPHFMKSALAGYTQQDFISLVSSFGISYHEKTLGQLFCDGSSQQIIQMLVTLCDQYGVILKKGCSVSSVTKGEHFDLLTSQGPFASQTLIVACGGLSIPQIGASDLGYRLAKQFGLKLISTRPALVPLTVDPRQRDLCTTLSGVSNPSLVSYTPPLSPHKKKGSLRTISFPENILFTHRGLSGPAILQISSYMEQFDGEELDINLLPHINLESFFTTHKTSKQTPAQFLKNHLANRLIDHVSTPLFHQSITDLSKESLLKIAQQLHHFKITIQGSEGYKKAEVTTGGVDTNDLSSQTMACKKIPSLFFIGEVVDVTGWLGGYNFQWAWSSGFAAGTHC